MNKRSRKPEELGQQTLLKTQVELHSKYQSLRFDQTNSEEAAKSTSPIDRASYGLVKGRERTKLSYFVTQLQ